MKIAILEQNIGDKTATGERCRAMEIVLRAKGHEVDVLAPSGERFAQFARYKFSFSSRLKRRLLGRKHLPHLWDYIADEMEPRLQAGKYEAVIARLQNVAYTLTREFDFVKIFDVANVSYLEHYHSWGVDLSELELYYEKELAIYQAVDYILSPHEIWTKYFRENVYDNDKVVTARLGCYLPERIAAYAPSPRLVYAGSYDYIQDPLLLSLLTKQSPYPIDCYGSRNPNYKFLPMQLNYRGYRPTPDFLADYQFGLITVSRDRLRQHSPATKFPYYFSYGLPVLFPEWMKEGHEYEAAIPYNEDNFVEQIHHAADEEVWRALSEKARRIAENITWDQVLSPLIKVLDNQRAEIVSPL
jgi:hypothetical protein